MTAFELSKPKSPTLAKNTMPDLKDYVTTEEAAETLSLHIETIRLFLRYKKLEGLKVGRTWLVSRKSVEQYSKETADKDKHDPRRKQK